jgi:hypothetical protein
MDSYRLSLNQHRFKPLQNLLEVLEVCLLLVDELKALLLPWLHPQPLAVNFVYQLGQGRLLAFNLTELHDGVYALEQNEFIVIIK